VSMRKLKHIPVKLKASIEKEVKMLLHAHRDTLRNQDKDTTVISFDVGDGYYGEAFGVMRTLALLNYGYFGSDNLDAIRELYSNYNITNISQDIQNLKWWFSEIQSKVLKEENFRGSNECDYCFERYRHDAVRKR